MLVKRRPDAVAQGGFADERRSSVYRREHSRADPRCLLLAALVRRLLSAPLVSSRRALTFVQPATTSSQYLRAWPPGRSASCMCHRTHTRGGGGILLARAPEIGGGNLGKLGWFIAPEAKANTTIKITHECLVRPRSQLSVSCVRADAHTRTHARNSVAHRRTSIAAHDRRARPRRWTWRTGSGFPDSRVREGSRCTVG